MGGGGKLAGSNPMHTYKLYAKIHSMLTRNKTFLARYLLDCTEDPNRHALP